MSVLKRYSRRTAIVLTAVVASIGLLSSPAAATPVTGYTWSGNHTICNGCSISQGNLIAMWQSIVISGVDGLGDCYNWVDGYFGPGTAAATRTWQYYHGLAQDGVVGPNTWAAAFQYTVYDHSAAGYDFFRYNAGNGNVWFRRNQSTLVWDFAGGIAPFSGTNHPGITSHGCIGIYS